MLLDDDDDDIDFNAPAKETKTVWVDFSLVDLGGDINNLRTNPLWIIVAVLAVLILFLFVLLAVDYGFKQYDSQLKGYILTHHKVPKWFTGELPHELQEHLDDYNYKKRKEFEEGLLIKPDSRMNKAVYVDKLDEEYQGPLTNKQLLNLLRDQKIGAVSVSGVTKTELMKLSGLNFSKLNYKYFKSFVGADLRYADFSEVEEEGLEFRGASLQFAIFVDAAMPNNNFSRTRLSYSNFFHAILDESLFIGTQAQKAYFSEARLVDVNLKDSVCLECDFSNAIMDGVNARYSEFAASNFANASLIDADFRDTDLHGVSFRDADLEGADFTNANLEGVNFSGANFKNVKLHGADVTQTNFGTVENATWEQLNQAKFLLSAYKVPEKLVPKKRSWQERFVTPYDKLKKN